MLEYNTARNQLINRGYGRNIQKMIEAAVHIEDRAKRNETAKAIIKTMAIANPFCPSKGNNSEGNDNNVSANGKNKERSSEDYWHTLWDHLFIISNYQLDVDSPFPKPTPIEHGDKLICQENYHKGGGFIRTYGRHLTNIIKTVSEYPENEQKIQLTKDIANLMKKLYLTWNRDTVDDTLIAHQLYELSDGKLVLPPDFVLISSHDILSQHNIATSNGPKKKKKKKKKKKTNTATL